MNGDLAVPADFSAERAVAGAALLHRLGARRAAAVLSGADFYYPQCRRLFEAALQLDDIGSFTDGSPVAWRPSSARVRAVAAAVMADVPFVVAEQLTTETPAMASPEPWAAEVVAAAERRRAMRALADAYNLLGEGGDLDEVASVLNKVAAA